MKIARERIDLIYILKICFTLVNFLMNIVNYMWLAFLNKYLKLNSDRFKIITQVDLE